MKYSSDRKSNTPQKYGHARRIIPIRRRIWQKVMIRWLVLIALGIAFFLLCREAKPMFRNFPQRYELSKWMTVAVYAVVVLMSRVLPLTFSREWTGKVTGREVQKYSKMTKGPFLRDVNGLPSLSTKCVWTVEKDDGYIEKVEYDTEEIWEGYFEIGERVRLYKNAKILVKAHPPHGEENLMCPLCATMIMEPVCRKCGVDFAEVEKTAGEMEK